MSTSANTVTTSKGPESRIGGLSGVQPRQILAGIIITVGIVLTLADNLNRWMGNYRNMGWFTGLETLPCNSNLLLHHFGLSRITRNEYFTPPKCEPAFTLVGSHPARGNFRELCSDLSR